MTTPENSSTEAMRAALDSLEKIQQWLNSSVNLSGGFDEEPFPASKFDYELSQAAVEMHVRVSELRSALSQTEQRQETVAQRCGACGKPWDGEKCGQSLNGWDFPVCYPVADHPPTTPALVEAAEIADKHAREAEQAGMHQAALAARLIAKDIRAAIEAHKWKV